MSRIESLADGAAGILPEQEGGTFLSRRTTIGLFGTGAVAALAGLAGCGGGDNNTANAATGPFTRGVVGNAFTEIMKDEDNHVAFLVAAITANGGTPRPAPTFDTTQAVWNPTSVATFYELADALENTGTGAYTYATQYLVSVPSVLVSAAGIALVEGRHAGFLNALTGRPLLTDPSVAGDHNDPTGKTFPTLNGGAIADASQEVPQNPALVLQRAAPFLVNVNLNGGPPPPADTFPGGVFEVLNYALLLEYLEKSWYDRNVPRFASQI
jgi:hypothetical protein